MKKNKKTELIDKQDREANMSRANQALNAVYVHSSVPAISQIKKLDQDLLDHMKFEGDDSNDGIAQEITDLSCNLQHLCAELNLNYFDLVLKGSGHFIAERTGAGR